VKSTKQTPHNKATRTIEVASIPDAFADIAAARHTDPFSVLGRHVEDATTVVRAYLPSAIEALIVETNTPLERVSGTDIFVATNMTKELPQYYQIAWTDEQNNRHQTYDPYCFAPQLSEYDIHLHSEGKHWRTWQWLGAHLHLVDDIDGVLFSVWAPNASRVSVVGDFNQWDGRRHPMRLRGESGIWELFIPALTAGELYKLEVRTDSGDILLKSDPYAREFEYASGTANRIAAETRFSWSDEHWIEKRKNSDWLHAPLSIYEVHLGSWQRNADGDMMSYRELAERLVEHVSYMGFTHIELLPITEHPFYGSWGYQTVGYYAATSRYGNADDLRYLIDLCHQHGIGVFADWVPGHFPKDAHGLARFDGTALYEHADPLRGEHRDWNTLIFNYGRHEVRNFLIANALYWLEEFHFDGLRVDAVASMLYLDFAREKDDWLPNKYGGRENLDAVEFLKQLNTVTHEQFPGTLVMAEESTDWPMVSRPVDKGGLGFSMKWNMGWMHDVLDYMKTDPIYRKHEHTKLTFGMMYNYNENFILPFSHDEVVHEKSSLLYKMNGDEWQKFANLRLLYCLMYTYPGKQLLFMGNEFGQGSEWNHDVSLDWHLLEYPLHKGLLKSLSDLNHLNRQHTALHYYDFEEKGFQWLDCHDTTQSVFSYKRNSNDESIIVVLNFTPIARDNYRIGVTEAGHYDILFNSDSELYGGSNYDSHTGYSAEEKPWLDHPRSICLNIPPLAGIILKNQS